MIGIESVVDYADDHASAERRVPHTGDIDILADSSTGLAGVAQVPLVAEARVVRNHLLAHLPFHQRIGHLDGSHRLQSSDPCRHRVDSTEFVDIHYPRAREVRSRLTDGILADHHPRLGGGQFIGGVTVEVAHPGERGADDWRIAVGDRCCIRIVGQWRSQAGL